MALYEITHRCGHTVEQQIYGTDVRGRRAWIAAQRAGELCAACARAEREAATAAMSVRAAELAALDGLPALVGSEKQVAWAERLRADKRAGAAGFAADLARVQRRDHDLEAALDAAITAQMGETSARWWIEHRTESGRDMARRLTQQIITSRTEEAS